MALNPIQGGKSIDLHDGMCFVADLISNCFFEINDVNILCFLGFQSSTAVELCLICCLCLAVGVMLELSLVVIIYLSDEFNGKH